MLIGTAILTIGLTGWLLWRRSSQEQPLAEQRQPPLLISLQLICGDCCGDADIPRRTEMSIDSTCRDCGGRAYVLAADYYFDITRRRRYRSFELTPHVLPLSLEAVRQRNRRQRGG
jgi:hypothetical protein